MKKVLLGFVCIAGLLSGCTKNEEIKIDETKSGLVKIKFDHIVGSKKLVLNDYMYSNASNETFNITSLNYYVSNIKFTKVNGEVITIPKKESCFHIDASDAKYQKPILTSPQGE